MPWSHFCWGASCEVQCQMPLKVKDCHIHLLAAVKGRHQVTDCSLKLCLAWEESCWFPCGTESDGTSTVAGLRTQWLTWQSASPHSVMLLIKCYFFCTVKALNDVYVFRVTKALVAKYKAVCGDNSDSKEVPLCFPECLYMHNLLLLICNPSFKLSPLGKTTL